MNHLSDELINKYIDKEASNAELNVINEHLAICGECAYKIKAARLTESVLHRMSPAGLSENFTDNVMAKIIKAEAKPAKQGNSFIKIVFSLFILAIGGTVGYGLSLAASPASGASSEPGLFDVLSNKASEFFANIHVPSEFKLFQNSEILGAVVIITLLTTGYYLYESHRELKKRAGQLR
ncbi:MAG TPA: zf-HC2 domain-containing protein [Ignavibacteriales bacterium]|nr:zf-HC2 domain-containing protein [Ignavibacteriales bacterium]